MALIGLTLLELVLAWQCFVNNYSRMYNTPTNALVADYRSRMEGWTDVVSTKVNFVLCEECLIDSGQQQTTIQLLWHSPHSNSETMSKTNF